MPSNIGRVLEKFDFCQNNFNEIELDLFGSSEYYFMHLAGGILGRCKNDQGVEGWMGAHGETALKFINFILKRNNQLEMTREELVDYYNHIYFQVNKEEYN